MSSNHNIVETFDEGWYTKCNWKLGNLLVTQGYPLSMLKETLQIVCIHVGVIHGCSPNIPTNQTSISTRKTSSILCVTPKRKLVDKDVPVQITKNLRTLIYLQLICFIFLHFLLIDVGSHNITQAYLKSLWSGCILKLCRFKLVFTYTTEIELRKDQPLITFLRMLYVLCSKVRGLSVIDIRKRLFSRAAFQQQQMMMNVSQALAGVFPTKIFASASHILAVSLFFTWLICLKFWACADEILHGKIYPSFVHKLTHCNQF